MHTTTDLPDLSRFVFENRLTINETIQGWIGPIPLVLVLKPENVKVSLVSEMI